MVKICVCYGCSNSSEVEGSRLHSFPPRESVCFMQWVEFVQTKRTNFSTKFVSNRTFICDSHFQESDYDEGHIMQCEMGLRKNGSVLLKPSAVPSIHASLTLDSSDSESTRISKAVQKLDVKSNLPNDVTNYVQFALTGGNLALRPKLVPHIFANPTKKKVSNTKDETIVNATNISKNQKEDLAAKISNIIAANEITLKKGYFTDLEKITSKKDVETIPTLTSLPSSKILYQIPPNAIVLNGQIKLITDTQPQNNLKNDNARNLHSKQTTLVTKLNAKTVPSKPDCQKRTKIEDDKEKRSNSDQVRANKSKHPDKHERRKKYLQNISPLISCCHPISENDICQAYCLLSEDVTRNQHLFTNCGIRSDQDKYLLSLMPGLKVKEVVKSKPRRNVLTKYSLWSKNYPFQIPVCVHTFCTVLGVTKYRIYKLQKIYANCLNSTSEIEHRSDETTSTACETNSLRKELSSQDENEVNKIVDNIKSETTDIVIMDMGNSWPKCEFTKAYHNIDILSNFKCNNSKEQSDTEILVVPVFL